MTTAIVSVDFDFFVRELPEWDWGHSENYSEGVQDTIWLARYAERDVKYHTDPRLFADFLPKSLPMALMSKGFVAPKGMLITGCDSHLRILSIIKEHLPADLKPDLLLNLDAHHDLFSEVTGEPNCGNWWTQLYDQWPETRHVHIVPKWQDTLDWYGKPVRPVEQMRWNDFKIDIKAQVEVVLLFICRSGAWVPPHLDHAFNEMLHQFPEGERLSVSERSVPGAAAIKKIKDAWTELDHSQVKMMLPPLKEETPERQG